MRRPLRIVAWVMPMPSCLRAVIVLGVGDADLAGRLDQRVVDRAGLVAFGDLQRAVAAAVFVVGVALVAFHVAEDRQHLAIAPAAIAELRPGVVVLRLAAHEDHAVDRGRAAQQLAARNGNAALAGALVGLRRIQPVGGGVFDQPGEADRECATRDGFRARLPAPARGISDRRSAGWRAPIRPIRRPPRYSRKSGFPFRIPPGLLSTRRPPATPDRRAARSRSQWRAVSADYGTARKTTSSCPSR